MNETIWRLDSFALFRMSSKIVVITCNLSQMPLNSVGYNVLSASLVFESLNVLIACNLHFSMDRHKVIPRRWAASHLRWFSTRVLAMAFNRCRIPMLSFFIDFECDGLSLTRIQQQEKYISRYNAQFKWILLTIQIKFSNYLHRTGENELVFNAFLSGVLYIFLNFTSIYKTKAYKINSRAVSSTLFTKILLSLSRTVTRFDECV